MSDKVLNFFSNLTQGVATVYVHIRGSWIFHALSFFMYTSPLVDTQPVARGKLLVLPVAILAAPHKTKTKKLYLLGMDIFQLEHF